MLIPTILILAFTGWVIYMFHRLIALRNQVIGVFCQVGVELEVRRDLMLKLIGAVKDGMISEKELLENAVKARADAALAASGNNAAEVARREEALTGILRQIITAAGNNPGLKTDETLKNITEEFARTAGRISQVVRSYNETVSKFNVWQKKVPNNIFSSMLSFDPFELLEISSDGRFS